jgi:hypothetical protein
MLLRNVDKYYQTTWCHRQKITKSILSAVRKKKITGLPLSYPSQIHLILRTRRSLLSSFIYDAFYLFCIDLPMDLIYVHVYLLCMYRIRLVKGKHLFRIIRKKDHSKLVSNQCSIFNTTEEGFPSPNNFYRNSVSC